ncbi:MAG: acyltransferase [Cyanobacteria bacterium CRU_2_1]|nr:acyltransferase [Cyanobacteria bacterium CRU_2_1]
MGAAASKTDVRRSKANVLNLTDFCKGLAILWIFLVHYQGGWFGWQGVHIFIVLSGFGLTYSCLSRVEPIEWSKWFVKRLRRILPAYWFAVVFSLPLLIAFQSVSGEPLWNPFVRTVLDLFLMTNVFEEFRGGATGAFWYVPFILGAYLLFPLLHNWIKKSPHWRGCLSLLLITMAIEFLYRAIAIYWLDGLPISYDNQRFIPIFPNSIQPLDQHADWFFGFFQRRSPFGFIPARLGEFVLGMVVAFGLIQNHQRMNRLLLNPYMGLVGLLIWLSGQALLYVGLWGWVFADFVIAAGLTLWTLNLAYLLQKAVPSLFRAITFLGIWSYYIYLVHQPFVRGLRGVEMIVTDGDVSLLTNVLANVLFLGFAAILTGIASVFLMKFDQSKFADVMFSRVSRAVSTSRI